MPSRREFLYAAAALTAARASAETPNIEEATLADLEAGLTAGRFTSAALVEQYFARIADVDKKINSVIELNPDAPAIAAALDRERKEKGPRSPLHGIPILIKDNIDTADKMMTTAGSLALAGTPRSKGCRARHPPSRSRRRPARQDQFERMGQLSLQPFHQRMERTRRPDSQSLCARPQSFRIEFWIRSRRRRQPLRRRRGNRNRRQRRLAVVDVRHRRHQAHARINSRRGHRPDFPSPGYRRSRWPRTVTDAALLLGALTGASYGQALDAKGLKGARIGVARQLFGFNDFVDKMMVDILGSPLQPGREIGRPRQYRDLFEAQRHGERSHVLRIQERLERLSSRARRPHAIAPRPDRLQRKKSRPKEMPYFDQDQFIKAEARGPLSSKAYRDLELKLSRAAKGRRNRQGDDRP